MYAVIEAGGRQYRVQAGDTLVVDRMEAEEGATISLGRVLMVNDAGDLKLGSPVVEGAVVKATVLEHDRDEKKIIFRYRNKNRYRSKKGHRQPITRLKIEAIEL